MKKFNFNCERAKKMAEEHPVGQAEGKNRFGMTLLEKNKKMSVESLKFNKQYQRATEVARKENVKKGIVTCGHFLPEKSITVNQANEVVDGQHRLLAAQELGLSHIPVSKYYFEDKDKEAAFFVYINGFDERLSVVDYWYAMYLSGDPLAETIYKLESEARSLLNNKVVIKGKKTDKSKISITQVLEIIHMAIGNTNRGNWAKADHEIWLKQLSKCSFDDVLKTTNDFIGWYETIFGNKKNTPWAYYLDSFRAIKYFYKALYSRGWHKSKDTVAKMKSFNLGATFMAAPLAGKKYQLIDHFNKNKKHKRLPYNIE